MKAPWLEETLTLENKYVFKKELKTNFPKSCKARNDETLKISCHPRDRSPHPLTSSAEKNAHEQRPIGASITFNRVSICVQHPCVISRWPFDRIHLRPNNRAGARDCTRIVRVNKKISSFFFNSMKNRNLLQIRCNAKNSLAHQRHFCFPQQKNVKVGRETSPGHQRISLKSHSLKINK